MFFELSLSIVSFLLAAYFIIVSFSMERSLVLAENSVFFPLFTAIFLVLLGILHLIFVLKKRNIKFKQLTWSKDVFIYMGIMLIYLIALPFLGYLPTSIAFCLIYLYVYKMKIKSKLSIIVALIIPVAIWVVFRFALKVALP